MRRHQHLVLELGSQSRTGAAGQGVAGGQRADAGPRTRGVNQPVDRRQQAWLQCVFSHDFIRESTHEMHTLAQSYPFPRHSELNVVSCRESNSWSAPVFPKILRRPGVSVVAILPAQVAHVLPRAAQVALVGHPIGRPIDDMSSLQAAFRCLCVNAYCRYT